MMAGLDWVIVGILLLSTVAAAAEGFFVELFSVGGVLLGFLVASWQCSAWAPWFEPYVKSPRMAEAAAFLLLLLAVMILAGVAGKIARWAMKSVGLSWVDRLLGAAFGLLRGAVVVTALVLALTAFVPESPWLQRSDLARAFLVTARVASWVVPAELQKQFQEGVALVRRAHMQGPAPAPDPGPGRPE
jgi:membrane protein required for colicin V production